MNDPEGQLRQLAFKTIHSTTKLLPAWMALLTKLKLPSRMMPRDVATRWNSTFDMLDFTLQYRSAIDAITDDRRMDLRQLELSEHEWKLASQLHKVLKVGTCLYLSTFSLSCDSTITIRQILKDATLFFSHSTPNLAVVIPAMDYIDQTLSTQAINSVRFEPAIRASLSLAKKTLNRYYTMTDSSEVYRIAMGMLHSFI
jgi:hypothetical protein